MSQEIKKVDWNKILKRVHGISLVSLHNQMAAGLQSRGYIDEAIADKITRKRIQRLYHCTPFLCNGYHCSLYNLCISCFYRRFAYIYYELYRSLERKRQKVCVYTIEASGFQDIDDTYNRITKFQKRNKVFARMVNAFTSDTGEAQMRFFLLVLNQHNHRVPIPGKSTMKIFSPGKIQNILAYIVPDIQLYRHPIQVGDIATLVNRGISSRQWYIASKGFRRRKETNEQKEE